jgi:hypothetical protein
MLFKASQRNLEENMKYKLPLILFLLLLSQLTLNASAAQSLFQGYVSFPTGNGRAVGIGDFNSDGINDVAITNSSQLYIYPQNNAGGLSSPAAYAAAYRPESVAVGDLNSDGRDDVVTGDVSTNTISLYLQQPDGTLASRVSFATGIGPDAVAVGDLNSDGRDDVAVSNWNSSFISIFTQTDAGTLNAMVTYASPQSGYDDIEIGDVNNDGRQDVVKMNGQGYVNPHLSVYLQNEAGTLNSAVSYSIGCTNCLANGVGTGDVTGDGLTDIVVSYGGNRPSAQLAVFAQAPDHSLQPAVSYPAYDIPDSVEVADVNNDGFADVVTTQSGFSNLGVFLQQNGVLAPYSLYTVPGNAQSMDTGDLNNDGMPDVAIADYLKGLVVLYHTPLDTTPPTISITAMKEDTNPYIADTWTYQTVILKYTCSDLQSGIASCPPDQVFKNDGVTQQVTATAIDNAGNSANITFGPIKVDKTPPTITMQVSPNPVLLHGTAAAVPNAWDGVSGINPTSVACFTIDTTSVGTKPTRCYVSDNAGNMAAAEVTYQVIYGFSGFLSPVIDCVNNSCTSYQLSSFNAGSLVALKFQLKDANGNLVQPAAAPLWLTPVQINSAPPVTFPENYSFQTSGAYTWKKSQNIYEYDWSTKKAQAKMTWLVGVKLDDGKTYYVFVYLK